MQIRPRRNRKSAGIRALPQMPHGAHLAPLLAGLGMLGPVLGPWAGRASARTDADVVLVEIPPAPAHAPPSDPESMACHMPGKSGSVLPVVPMSSMRTPGIIRPMTAAAVAMRWSPYDDTVAP